MTLKACVSGMLGNSKHVKYQNIKICPCRILQNDPNPDAARWLPGARLNIAECALCCRDPDAAALLWAEEGAPDVLRRVTLRSLRASSFRVAAALWAAGFRPGERRSRVFGLEVWHPPPPPSWGEP